MKKDVLRLMNDYRKKSFKALTILHKNRKVLDYSNPQNRSGVLRSNEGEEVKFKFHGIECWFKFENGEFIDIDFGGGRIDQIDKYFLIDFWESSKINYPSLTSKEDIEDQLERLVADKEIEKIDGKYNLIDNGDIPSVFYLQD